MAKELSTHQLFRLTTKIQTYDEHNYLQKILEEVGKIFDFKAYAYLHIFNQNEISLSHFFSREPEFLETSLFKFLDHELFSWNIEENVYIASLGIFSVIGIPFQKETWGIFISDKHPLNEDIQGLLTFAKSVSIWFDFPQIYQLNKSSVKASDPSDRKYAALQSLYSIAEWTWDVATNECEISHAFLAFFDHARVKDSYSISDIYYLIGDQNTDRFKACIQKVACHRHQVFEEFKCQLLDKKTYQNIQILFDPICDGNDLVRIIGYCKDNGRIYSSNNTVKWYDSEWLHNLSLIPIEWVVRSNYDCEITTSTLHQIYFKENLTQFIGELSKHLKKYLSANQTDLQLNMGIKFPFSKFRYQLIAAKSDLDPFIWRGIIVFLNEKNTSMMSLDREGSGGEYNQMCANRLFQEMSNMQEMANYYPYINYVLGMSRYSKDIYLFDDFWEQVEHLIELGTPNVWVKKNIQSGYYVPNAQLGLSLISFLINQFNLLKYPIQLTCTEPSLIELPDTHTLLSRDIIEVSIDVVGAPKVPVIIQRLLQVGLMGTGIDVSFLSDVKNFKCSVYFEVNGPKQPLIIDSKKSYRSSNNLKKNTILIVDDDQYNIQTLQVLLRGEGLETISAFHGKQAIHILNTDKSIDAVILDLRMPVMDGFDFLDHIKSNRERLTMPIMVLSANITPDTLETLRQYHVSSVLEKPFDVDELIVHIKQLISTKTTSTVDDKIVINALKEL